MPRPDRAAAAILTFEAHVAGAQGAQDLGGDVVAPVPAAGIPARKDEERWSVLDDNASDVRRFRNRTSLAPLGDLEGQALKAWHRSGKSRCLVLPLTALGESLSRFAESSVVLQLDSSIQMGFTLSALGPLGPMPSANLRP